tara:strand:- start:1615 stop:2604 length:990 start_codon:yes stop_codon:yes gene_type:complete
MSKTTKYLSFLMVVFWCVGSAIYLGNRPTGLAGSHPITIKPGTTAQDIGKQLESRGIIRSQHIFSWTVRLFKQSKSLKAGEYELNGLQSTISTISLLQQAPIVIKRATIPEGLTILETGEILEAQNIVNAKKFVQLATDPVFTKSHGIPASTLEGYLFPETYHFSPTDDEKQVINRMVNQFNKVFTDSLEKLLKHVNLTRHKLVTLASIVELEAQKKNELTTIAGVFLRRLSLNRRLESCATVEFAIGQHKERLTHQDLQIESPYNTYRNLGLPPGPIGNPGKSALWASLNPETTDFLYFVSKGDGSHVFSRTNREHERAKRKIRLSRQ